MRDILSHTKGFVYIIRNRINKKFYLGSTRNYKSRRAKHLYLLRKNKHHSEYLQNSWNKYGEVNFDFIIIETCCDYIYREQYLLDKLNLTEDTYNMTGKAVAGNPPKKYNPKYKEKNPNWRGGKTFCACGIRINSGSLCCAECRDRTGERNPFYRRKHSKETILKLSENLKGKYNGNQEKPTIIEYVEYNSVTHASKMLNVCVATIVFRIKSKNIKFKNYNYKIMNTSDQYYKQNLSNLLNYGSTDVNPRAKYKDGTPAHTKFITQVFEKYDISKGEFPIPTIRNTAIKTGIKEILWIYQKASNKLSDAHDLGIKWWDEWEVDDTGEIGSVYGYTVGEYRLIPELLDNLKINPFGRRHIMNLWQEDHVYVTKGLVPCAYETIWSCREVEGDVFVDMTLIQRSSDYIVAGFINKVQYVALQMMVCGHLGYKVGIFAHMTQNLHVYDRHLNALKELLEKPPLKKKPKLVLKENKNFFEYTIDDFKILLPDGITKIESPIELAI